jgi:xanthine/uracil permease
LCQQRRIHDPRKLTTVVLAMGLAWLMLFGPAVEHATYVFLTPVLNWALLQRDGWQRGRWLIIAAFVLVMFLGWAVVSPAVMETAPILLTVLPVGTVLFTFWLIGYAPLHLRVNQYAQAINTPCNGNRSQMRTAGNCG